MLVCMRILTLALGYISMTLCAGCGGPADSPEDAIAAYLDAADNNSRSGLRTSWWVSEDPAIRDCVIERSIAVSEFHEKLEKQYTRELNELVEAGRLSKRDNDSPPTSSEIREAVDRGRAHAEDGEDQLFIILSGDRFHVGKHGGHWYVEHGFVSVDRTWTQKELEFDEALTDLYRRLKDRIGKPGETGLGLLNEVRSDLQELMRQYDIPFLLFGG